MTQPVPGPELPLMGDSSVIERELRQEPFYPNSDSPWGRVLYELVVRPDFTKIVGSIMHDGCALTGDDPEDITQEALLKLMGDDPDHVEAKIAKIEEPLSLAKTIALNILRSGLRHQKVV